MRCIQFEEHIPDLDFGTSKSVIISSILSSVNVLTVDLADSKVLTTLDMTT
jgi:hypothetical protein